jgi:hypothetical protein
MLAGRLGVAFTGLQPSRADPHPPDGSSASAWSLKETSSRERQGAGSLWSNDDRW